MAKTGTKEWAEDKQNIITGCEHDCLYCYAKANALRYKQIKDEKEWRKPKLRFKALDKKPYKKKGRIMFPTTHDIPIRFIDDTIDFLKKWLALGNEFLIVSKPHFDCINKLTHELERWKDQITFRFTIGSTDDDTLLFWEPGAPDFMERLRSLKVAYTRGFNTSVSCEPYLDKTIVALVMFVMPYITDTVWIGKMNRIADRVNTRGWGVKEHQYLSRVTESQTNEQIDAIYEVFKDNEKVKWKDSIKRILGLPEEDGVA